MDTLYTAKVQVAGGRDGTVRSDDGKLDLRLAFPTTLGGTGEGTNPEQLFAAGYAACFATTLGVVARTANTPLAGVTVRAEVDMLHDRGTYDLAVRLAVRASGADRQVLAGLIEQTRQACPYARATRSSLTTTIRIEE